MRKMGMVADTLAISVATPFAQSIAQVPLSMTRAAVNRGNAMSVNVRDQLTRLAGQPTDSQRATEQPTPVQHQTRQHNLCRPLCSRVSPRNAASPVPAQPEPRQPAPIRVPGEFAPRATLLALSEIPMLGGEAPAEASAAPTSAAFQPRPEGTTHAEAAAQQRDMLVGGQQADARTSGSIRMASRRYPTAAPRHGLPDHRAAAARERPIRRGRPSPCWPSRHGTIARP